LKISGAAVIIDAETKFESADVKRRIGGETARQAGDAPPPGIRRTQTMKQQETFKGSSKYVASQELTEAVNVSMALQKPLLIKGEPGTGKTMLAEAIAESLDKPLIIWSIKSTTKAQDGLYVYDTVQRLYDSQFGEGNVADVRQYIKLGKLGEAFTSERQVVLLIDEIDKADLEFPNDLLWELDRMEFYIHETRETITTKTRPIVIITSNAEKELPDAFLRRCIFHYIAFPDEEKMREIVRVHFGDIDKKLLDAAMKTFYEIRAMDDLSKKPSTSELLDWLQALMISGVDVRRIGEEIPYVGVLLKKNEDIDIMYEIKEKGYSLSRW
jgi:MoxR-like ATPase